jgi:hypothetical protein
MKMTNRRRNLLSFAFAALVALLLPALDASAQVPTWGRNRDYGNDRHYGYDTRGLRDAIRRVESRSDDFQNHVDRALDRSRYDDTRREDRINDIAREFRNASQRLRSRFNERDINRSSNEARQLLQIASRIDRFMSRNRLDSRAESEWSQMRSDLRVIANAYRIGMNDSYDDGYYRRGQNDDYRRDRQRDNDRNRRNNDRGWRWPF